MKYAADQGKPCVFVLFDYTTWSGFGTQLFRALGESLLGRNLGFKSFPAELSALAYLERKERWSRLSAQKIRVAK
jgi:hypothetical protein